MAGFALQSSMEGDFAHFECAKSLPTGAFLGTKGTPNSNQHSRHSTEEY